LGKISDWIDPDSDDLATRVNAESVLLQELQWAYHLGLTAVLLPTPREGRCTNYGAFVANLAQSSQYTQLLMRIPLMSKRSMSASSLGTCVVSIGSLSASNEHQATGVGNRSPAHPQTPLQSVSAGQETQEQNGNAVDSEWDTWEDWNVIRTLSDHNARLGVALELTADLPSQSAIERWVAEPVKALIIPTSSFINNVKGYPVLPKRHQAVVRLFLKVPNLRFAPPTLKLKR
jgi:protein arginine N-methyltransferase 5